MIICVQAKIIRYWIGQIAKYNKYLSKTIYRDFLKNSGTSNIIGKNVPYERNIERTLLLVNNEIVSVIIIRCLLTTDLVKHT